MSEYKQKITEEMDKCLVTKNEWEQMQKSNMKQEFTVDPFASYWCQQNALEGNEVEDNEEN